MAIPDFPTARLALRRHRVTRARVRISLAVPLAVAGCAAGADARLPWWPAPRAALPSPLLDAVGLAPPALAGPECRRDGGGAGPGWRGDLARFLHGYGSSCTRALTAPAPGATLPDHGLVTASFDSRGRAYHAAYTSPGQQLAAAHAAADSAVARGLRLPGARALGCPDAVPAARSGGWVDSTVRGWETPDYQTVVFVHQGGRTRRGATR
jgi:hypothetical protein